jgi:hypothetical protein
MRRLLVICSIVALAVLSPVSSSIAQQASPSPQATLGQPLPYAEYVAALEELRSQDPMAELGATSTTDDVVAAMEEMLVLAEGYGVWLDTVVPEPCYAFAHEELSAYWQSAIELYREFLPLLAPAETVVDMLPTVEAMDEELRLRHPSAYVQAADPTDGFQGSPFNILDAMAACEPTNAAATDTPSLAPTDAP